MSFAHPEAFSLFAVLAIFVFIAVYNFQKKNKLIEAFISSTAYKRLGIRSGREIDFFKTSLITLALAFFIIALAGPQWGEQFENVEIPLLWGTRAVIQDHEGLISVVDLEGDTARLEIVGDKPAPGVEFVPTLEGFQILSNIS